MVGLTFLDLLSLYTDIRFSIHPTLDLVYKQSGQLQSKIMRRHDTKATDPQSSRDSTYQGRADQPDLDKENDEHDEHDEYDEHDDHDHNDEHDDDKDCNEDAHNEDEEENIDSDPALVEVHDIFDVSIIPKPCC